MKIARAETSCNNIMAIKSKFKMESLTQSGPFHTYSALKGPGHTCSSTFDYIYPSPCINYTHPINVPVSNPADNYSRLKC